MFARALRSPLNLTVAGTANSITSFGFAGRTRIVGSGSVEWIRPSPRYGVPYLEGARKLIDAAGTY